MRSTLAGRHRQFHTRARAALRSARGAFDLPSIIAGVVVVAILAAGVLAALFGVTPWAQDNAAKQDLAAVRTAEGVAKTKDSKFLKTDKLKSQGYISAKAKKIAAGTDPEGTCYVALASGAANVFYATDKKSDPKELKSDTMTGCLTAEELAELLAELNGDEPGATPWAEASTPAVPVSLPDPKPGITGWGNAAMGQMGNALAGGTAARMTPTEAVFAAAPTKINNVSAGRNFSCAAADDKAYCWGENALGGTGLGAVNGQTNSPTAVGGLLSGKKVTAVSASTQTACAIADTAYCWGRNYNGQLTTGNAGASAYSLVPVKISGVLLDKPFSKISVGYDHICGISEDKAYCWGNSYDGRVGSFFSLDQKTPFLVAGPLAGKKVTDIDAGGNHTCAIADGQLYCFGDNAYGQLGIGSTTDTYTPTLVGGLLAGKTVTAVSAGGDGQKHTCAIADGAAYCWGSDAAGRLGNGTGNGMTAGAPVTTPAAVVNLAGKTVSSISTGEIHTCLVADGAGYCFGDGRSGLLGDGVPSWSSIPIAVTGLKGKLISIDAGGFHNTAIYDTANAAVVLPAAAPKPALPGPNQPGIIKAFGRSDFGYYQLGTGTAATTNPTPATVNGLSNVTKVAAGVNHTCAISNDTAYCWGFNSMGQLGNGTKVQSTAPVQVQGLTGKKVTDIGAGYQHSCAIADGQGYCWGSDTRNHLGNGNTVGDSLTASPLATSQTGTPLPIAGKTLTSLSVGYEHSCAIADYKAYCWGYGNNSEIGSAPLGKWNPNQIMGDLARKTVTAVSAGYNTTCAVADGEVYCLGSNAYGQLGNNSAVITDMVEPVKVGGLLAGKTATAVSTGGSTSCAIADGAAYCWGSDYYGQAGNGRVDGSTDVNATGTPVTKNYLAPVKVVDTGVLAGKTVTAISAGNDQAGDRQVCAVASGAAYCWGYGKGGQLGTGALLNSDVPVAVIGVTGEVISISAGRAHTAMTVK